MTTTINLHPRTLAAIAAGPLTDKRLDWLVIEPPKDFARRIALIAMEEEREEALRICAVVAANWNASVAEGTEVDGYETSVIAAIEDAIRRRGKP